MKKVALSCGFVCELEEQKLDNMELIDAVASAEENPVHLSKVLDLLLDKEQKKKLYDHLRTEKGNVPLLAVSNAIAEIFRGTGETGKNS